MDEQTKIKEKLKELQPYHGLVKSLIDTLRLEGRPSNVPLGNRLQIIYDVMTGKKACPSLEFLNKAEKTLNLKPRKRIRVPSPEVIRQLHEIEKQVENIKSILNNSTTVPSTSRGLTKNTKKVIDTIVLTSSDEDDDDDIEFISATAPVIGGDNTTKQSRDGLISSENKALAKKDTAVARKKIEVEEMEEGELPNSPEGSDIIVIEVLEDNSDVENNDGLSKTKTTIIESNNDLIVERDKENIKVINSVKENHKAADAGGSEQSSIKNEPTRSLATISDVEVSYNNVQNDPKAVRDDSTILKKSTLIKDIANISLKPVDETSAQQSQVVDKSKESISLKLEVSPKKINKAGSETTSVTKIENDKDVPLESTVVFKVNEEDTLTVVKSDDVSVEESEIQVENNFEKDKDCLNSEVECSNSNVSEESNLVINVENDNVVPSNKNVITSEIKIGVIDNNDFVRKSSDLVTIKTEHSINTSENKSSSTNTQNTANSNEGLIITQKKSEIPTQVSAAEKESEVQTSKDVDAIKDRTSFPVDLANESLVSSTNVEIMEYSNEDKNLSIEDSAASDHKMSVDNKVKVSEALDTNKDPTSLVVPVTKQSSASSTNLENAENSNEHRNSTQVITEDPVAVNNSFIVEQDNEVQTGNALGTSKDETSLVVAVSGDNSVSLTNVQIDSKIQAVETNKDHNSSVAIVEESSVSSTKVQNVEDSNETKNDTTEVRSANQTQDVNNILKDQRSSDVEAGEALDTSKDNTLAAIAKESSVEDSNETKNNTAEVKSAVQTQVASNIFIDHQISDVQADDTLAISKDHTSLVATVEESSVSSNGNFSEEESIPTEDPVAPINKISINQSDSDVQASYDVYLSKDSLINIHTENSSESKTTTEDSFVQQKVQASNVGDTRTNTTLIVPRTKIRSVDDTNQENLQKDDKLSSSPTSDKIIEETESGKDAAKLPLNTEADKDTITSVLVEKGSSEKMDGKIENDFPVEESESSSDKIVSPQDKIRLSPIETLKSEAQVNSSTGDINIQVFTDFENNSNLNKNFVVERAEEKSQIDIADAAEKDCSERNWEFDDFNDTSSDIVIRLESDISNAMIENEVPEFNNNNEQMSSPPATQTKDDSPVGHKDENKTITTNTHVSQTVEEHKNSSVGGKITTTDISPGLDENKKSTTETEDLKSIVLNEVNPEKSGEKPETITFDSVAHPDNLCLKSIHLEVIRDDSNKIAETTDKNITKKKNSSDPANSALTIGIEEPPKQKEDGTSNLEESAVINQVIELQESKNAIGIECTIENIPTHKIKNKNSTNTTNCQPLQTFISTNCTSQEENDREIVKTIHSRDRDENLSEISEDENALPPPFEDKYMALIDSIDQHLSDVSETGDIFSENEESDLYNCAISKQSLNNVAIITKTTSKTRFDILPDETKTETRQQEKNVDVSTVVGGLETTSSTIEQHKENSTKSGDDRPTPQRDVNREGTPLLDEISEINSSDLRNDSKLENSTTKGDSISPKEFNENNICNQDEVSREGTPLLDEISESNLNKFDIDTKVATDNGNVRKQVSYESLVNDGILAIHDSDTEDFIKKLNNAISGTESISSRSASPLSTTDKSETNNSNFNIEKVEDKKNRKKHKKHKKSHRRRSHRRSPDKSPSHLLEIFEEKSSKDIKNHYHNQLLKDGSLSPNHLHKYRSDSFTKKSKEEVSGSSLIKSSVIAVNRKSKEERSGSPQLKSSVSVINRIQCKRDISVRSRSPLQNLRSRSKSPRRYSADRSHSPNRRDFSRRSRSPPKSLRSRSKSPRKFSRDRSPGIRRRHRSRSRTLRHKSRSATPCHSRSRTPTPPRRRVKDKSVSPDRHKNYRSKRTHKICHRSKSPNRSRSKRNSREITLSSSSDDDSIANQSISKLIEIVKQKSRTHAASSVTANERPIISSSDDSSEDQSIKELIKLVAQKSREHAAPLTTNEPPITSSQDSLTSNQSIKKLIKTVREKSREHVALSTENERPIISSSDDDSSTCNESIKKFLEMVTEKSRAHTASLTESQPPIITSSDDSSTSNKSIKKFIEIVTQKSKVTAAPPTTLTAIEPPIIIIDDDDEEEIVQENKTTVESGKLPKEEFTGAQRKLKKSPTKEDLESVLLTEGTLKSENAIIYEGTEVIGTRRAKPVNIETKTELEQFSLKEELLESSVKKDNSDSILENLKFETTAVAHIENIPNETKIETSGDQDRETFERANSEEVKTFRESSAFDELRKALNSSENKSKDDEKEDLSDLQKTRKKLQCFSSRSSSPVIVKSSDIVDPTKKSDKMDEWADKNLGELQEIRIKLESDLGLTLDDIKDYFENPIQEPEQEDSNFPQEDNVTEFSDVPSIQDFMCNFQSNATSPQPVPPPHIAQSHPIFDMNYFVQPTSRASYDLPQRLGLPQGINPNDPRFKNRLRLLYNRTTDSRLEPNLAPREPQVPMPTEFLGPNMESIQADIRTACLEQIGTMAPNITHLSQHVPPRQPQIQKPTQVRTYGEYKRLKQQALEASAARRRAAVAAANKALESEMIAKPRDPESGQNVHASAGGESIIDKMYRTKKYEIDVKTPSGFRIPKKKDEEPLKDIEAILSAIDGDERAEDLRTTNKQSKATKKVSTSIRKKDKENTSIREKDIGKSKGKIVDSDDDSVTKSSFKKRKVRRISSSSSEGENVSRKPRSLSRAPIGRKVGGTPDKNNTLKPNKKPTVSPSSIGANTRRPRGRSRASMPDNDDIFKTKKNISDTMSKRARSSSRASKERMEVNEDSLDYDVFKTNEIIEASYDLEETLSKISPKKEEYGKENNETELQSSVKESPDKSRKMIKDLIQSLFNPKGQSHSEYALNLLEPFVSQDKFKEIKNVVCGETQNAAPPSASIQIEKVESIVAKKKSSPLKEEETKAVQIGPRNTAGSRELDSLYRDIQDMFIKDGRLTLSGRRMCSIASEKRTSLQIGKRKIDISPSLDTSEDESISSRKRCKSIAEELQKPYHGDESADTDDFEEHLKNKVPEKSKPKKKQKLPAELPLVKVRLKKLKTTKKPANTPAPSTSKKQVEEDDALLLKPLKVIPYSEEENKTKGRGRAKQKAKKVEVKNINPEHNIRNKKHTGQCVLCSERSQDIVDHYVSAHAEREVFVSRLHSDDIDYLTKNPIIATRIPGTQKKFSATCAFCDEEIKSKFINFHDHYSSHTGEYAFECSNCDVRKCTKRALLKHCKNECYETNSKCEINYSYEKNLTKIKAYICSKCNFIQLHKANVVKHLRSEHALSVVYESDTQELVLVEKIDSDEVLSDIRIANEPVLNKQDDGEILFVINTNKAVAFANRILSNVECNESNSRTDTAESGCSSSENVTDTSIAVKTELNSFEDLERILTGVASDDKTTSDVLTETFSNKNNQIMTMIHVPTASLGKEFDDGTTEQKVDVETLQEIIRGDLTEPSQQLNLQPEITDDNNFEQKPDIQKLSEIVSNNTKSEDETAVEAIADMKPTKEELDVVLGELENMDFSFLQNQMEDEHPETEANRDLSCEQATTENPLDQNLKGEECLEEIPKPNAEIIDLPNDQTTQDDLAETEQNSCEFKYNAESRYSSLQHETQASSKNDDDVIWIEDDEDCQQDLEKAPPPIVRSDKTKELQKLIMKAITDDEEDAFLDEMVTKEEKAENFEETITVIDVIEEEKDDVDEDDSFPRLEIDLPEELQHESQSEPLEGKHGTNDDPTISRIVNVGFQKIAESQYRYYCLIEGCSFLSSSDPEELKTHVKSMHRKQWSGRCNTCKQRVTDGMKLQISQELDHMLEVHIKQNELFPSPNKRMKLTETESESNDRLRPSKQITGSEENTTYLNPIICLLKPWVKKTICQKSKVLCYRMKDELSLYCLYKCMGNNCSFSTSSKLGMSYHLLQHETRHVELQADRPWLECSYCEHVADNYENILNHVFEIHRTSKFQCSKCFYRSSTAYNILIHQKLFHLFESDNAILTCYGKLKSTTTEMPEMFEKRAANVKPLVCEVCNATFYVIDYLQRHMKAVHGKQSYLVNVGLYACIYCRFETNDLITIREHMANSHPSELLYVCGRLVNRESALLSSGADLSTINSTSLVHIGGKVDKSAFKKCPIPETELHKTEVNFGGRQCLIEPNIVDLTDPEDTTLSATSLRRRSSSSEIAQKYDVKIMSFDELEKILQPTESSKTEVKKLQSEQKENLYKKLLELINMVTKINSQKVYACCISSCPEVFSTFIKWKNHLKLKHPDSSYDIKYKCPHCPEEYLISDFDSHFERHKMHRYFCYFCGKTFLQASVAEEHLVNSHCHSKARIVQIVPQDSEHEQSNNIKINNVDRYLVVTAPLIRNDSTSLLQQMIKVLTKRCNSNENRDTPSTSKDGKESKRKISLDNITIDLNSDVLDKYIPAFVKSSQRYVCNLNNCKFKALGEVHFECHYKESHVNINKFKCVHCNMDISNVSFVSFAKIRDHFKLHSGLVYLCCICNFYTYSRPVIIRHIGKDHKRMDVPIISYLRTEIDKKKQIEIIHVKRQRTKDFFKKLNKCLFCDQKHNESHMTKHLKDDHEIILRFQCDYCSYSSTMDDVEKHLPVFHKSFRYKTIFHRIGDDDGIDDCTIVNATLASVTAVEENSIQCIENSSTLKRPYPAENDESQSSTNSNGKRFKLNENVFHCTDCQFLADSKESLDEHVKINHEQTVRPNVNLNNKESPKHTALTEKLVHKCDGCMYVSDNIDDLGEHIRINHLDDDDDEIETNSNAANITINYGNSPSKPESVINVTVSYNNNDAVPSSVTNPTASSSEMIYSPQEISKEPPKKTTIRLVPMEKLLRSDLIETQPQNSIQTIQRLPTSLQQDNIDEEFIDINAPLTSDYLHNLLLQGQQDCIITDSSASNELQTTASVQKNEIRFPIDGYKPSLDEIEFLCYHCPTKFEQMEHLLKHWSLNHCPVHAKLNFKYRIARKICCVHCGHKEIFTRLKEHHIKHHGTSPMATSCINHPMRCSECQYVATTGKEELIMHANSVHKNLVGMTDASYNFLDQQLLDKLLQLGRASYSNKCNYCNEIYQDQTTCISHVQSSHHSQHRIPPYKRYLENSITYGCKQCTVIYDREKYAVQHLRNHTSPYVCNFCSFIFKDYLLLRNHYKVIHQSYETGYRYVSVRQNLPFYKAMLLIFPNGLVMTKGDLQNTTYGEMNDFLQLIESVEKEELTKCASTVDSST